jgi:hypothetical protein
LQLTIRDIAIEELFKVATSLVAAKRNVVLYKLMSKTYGKNEVSTIAELTHKMHRTTVRLTFNEPRIADPVVHDILWSDNYDPVTNVVRSACHDQQNTL